VAVRAHFLELVNQRAFSDEVTPMPPESVLNGDLTASQRLPASVHILFLLEDRRKTTRLICRLIPAASCLPARGVIWGSAATIAGASSTLLWAAVLFLGSLVLVRRLSINGVVESKEVTAIALTEELVAA